MQPKALLLVVVLLQLGSALADVHDSACAAPHLKFNVASVPAGGSATLFVSGLPASTAVSVMVSRLTFSPLLTLNGLVSSPSGVLSTEIGLTPLTPPATYTVRVVFQCNGEQHSASIPLTVTAPAMYDSSAAPESDCPNPVVTVSTNTPIVGSTVHVTVSGLPTSEYQVNLIQFYGPMRMHRTVLSLNRTASASSDQFDLVLPMYVPRGLYNLGISGACGSGSLPVTGWQSLTISDADSDCPTPALDAPAVAIGGRNLEATVSQLVYGQSFTVEFFALQGVDYQTRNTLRSVEGVAKADGSATVSLFIPVVPQGENSYGLSAEVKCGSTMRFTSRSIVVRTL